MNYKVTDTELTSIANAIRTKGGTQAQLEFPDEFISAIEDISGGGGSKNILSGTDVPTASVGSNGDVYLQVFDDIELSNASLNIGEVPSTNWIIEMKIKLPESRAEITKNGVYPSFWSEQNNSSASRFYALLNFYNATPRLEVSGQQVANYNVSYGEEIVIKYENGIVIIEKDDVEIVRVAMSNPSPVSNLVLFGSSFGNLPCIVKYVKIWDGNNDLIFNLIPASNGMYDSVSDSVFTFTGTVSKFPNSISDAFCKVNGAWQDLIGTDIDDVNTGE